MPLFKRPYLALPRFALLERIILMLLPGVVFLGFWEWIVHGNARLQFLFASPVMVVDIARVELLQSAIWHDVWITCCEAGLGVIFGTILGTACGLLLWGNGRIDYITRPYLVIIGSVPIFALAPMIIIWFGIGLLSKVVMAGFAVFFVSLLQAYEGATVTARQHLGFARSIDAPQRRVIQKIIIPGAIDWVMAGLRLSIGLALMGAFIGEFVASEQGLGHYILKAGAVYDMPRVIFGLVMLSVLALVMTALTKLMPVKERRHP